MQRLEAFEPFPAPKDLTVIPFTRADIGNHGKINGTLHAFQHMLAAIAIDNKLTNPDIRRSLPSYPCPQARLIWQTPDGIKRKICAVIDPNTEEETSGINLVVLATAWIMEGEVKYTQDSLSPFLPFPVENEEARQSLEQAFATAAAWTRDDLVDSRILDARDA